MQLRQESDIIDVEPFYLQQIGLAFIRVVVAVMFGTQRPVEAGAGREKVCICPKYVF
jgi:hypothetical protein